MEYLGLVLEVLFFALGVYVYLFARGFVRVKNPELQARAEDFRQDNAGWMRLLGLAVAAVMLLNIVLHVMDLASQ